MRSERSRSTIQTLGGGVRKSIGSSSFHVFDLWWTLVRFGELFTAPHPVLARNAIVVATSQFRQPVRLIFGALCLAAGIVKFFPGIEDVGAVLREAERVNAGSWLVGLGAWLASHSAAIGPMIGALFIGWSLCLLTGRYVRAAAWSQLPVLAVFVILLAAARPPIVLIDAPFLAAALFLLRLDRSRP